MVCGVWSIRHGESAECAVDVVVVVCVCVCVYVYARAHTCMWWVLMDTGGNPPQSVMHDPPPTSVPLFFSCSRPSSVVRCHHHWSTSPSSLG